PPIDARGTRLARWLVRRPQKVWSQQVREGRQDPVWIVGSLRRKALEFWCDSWGSQSLSCLSVQLPVMPGVAFPPVGSVGFSSPPSPGPCAAKTASLPCSGHFAGRSRPDTLFASVGSWCPRRARARDEAPKPRQGFWSPGPPCRECDKETGGSPTFP